MVSLVDLRSEAMGRASWSRSRSFPPLAPIRVLVSNDDGIRAPGLRALVAALSSAGGFEVVVCAPAEEQSAKSHAISVRERLHASVGEVPGAVEAWAVAGTPADSVMLGLSGRLLRYPHEFDVVASGINRGDNCGLHVHYSGTVGAAREAACKGVPAVALSHSDHRARDEESYRECARESVAIIRAMGRSSQSARGNAAGGHAGGVGPVADGRQDGPKLEEVGANLGGGGGKGTFPGAGEKAGGRAALPQAGDDAAVLAAAEDAHPFAHSCSAAVATEDEHDEGTEGATSPGAQPPLASSHAGPDACVRAPALDYEALSAPSASPLAGSVINVNFPERCTAGPARGVAVARVGRACVLPNFRERQTGRDDGSADETACRSQGGEGTLAATATADAAVTPSPAPIAPLSALPASTRSFLNLHGGHAHEGRPDSDTVLVRRGWTAVSPLALDNDLPLSKRSAELRHDLDLVKELALRLRDAARELGVAFAPGEAREALEEGELEERQTARAAGEGKL